MSALPNLVHSFHALERLVEVQPEGVTAEIAAGVYAMSPRPRARHAAVETRLARFLDAALGAGPSGGEMPDWLFLIEPELRDERALSRVVPDLAAWRSTTSGWPSPDDALIELMPDWVGEILSPTTEVYDRGPKREAYGMMGVGWLWLVDPDRKRVEVFTNVRGQMLAGPVFESGSVLDAVPFEGVQIPLDGLFLI
jgi:Uma2 family endonuclease